MADLCENSLRLPGNEYFGSSEEKFLLLTERHHGSHLVFGQGGEFVLLTFLFHNVRMLLLVLGQVLGKYFFVFLLLGIINGEFPHEEVAGVLVLGASLSHVEVVIAATA